MLLFAGLLIQPLTYGAESNAVPVLLYHRLGPVVADSMTIRTSTFAAQLQYLHEHAYTVIPLRRLTDYLTGEAPPPPAKSVVITADDGHQSIYTELFPLIVKYRIPVTLFIYPSAISNASYALTWPQLNEMQASGLVDIQSHTYWHPNFKREKAHLDATAYEKLVDSQLQKSKAVLQRKTGKNIDMLAWPYGIFDDELINHAKKSGYIAGFSLERRPAERGDNMLTLPRYLITDQVSFEKLLATPAREKIKGKP
jgi:peptidoglycan/xylan/chitin deacetylase (PgdA/CDA1 family)